MIVNNNFNSILLTFGLVMSLINCSSELNNEQNTVFVKDNSYKNDEAIAMLNEFYSIYIPTVESSMDEKAIIEVQDKYCKASLLIKIRNRELKYDPFLNAQDADQAWLQSLNIEAVGNHEFKVTYISSFDGEEVQIVHVVEKIGDNYLIADIKNLK